MFCVTDVVPSTAYWYDPIYNLGINKYLRQLEKPGLFLSGQFDLRLLDCLNPDKEIYILEAEEPNLYYSLDGFYERQEKYNEVAKKILTICPFSAEWLNKEFGSEKRVAIPFPTDHERIPYCSTEDKSIDVIYTGHLVSNYVGSLIVPMTHFKYAWVSGSWSKNPLVTHSNVSYDEKLGLISKSKVAIVHNLLWLGQEHIDRLNAVPNWRNNRAFDLLQYKNIPMVPQIKSRVFEAAFCGALILCLKDPWNLIEKYFEPNVDFLYLDPATEDISEKLKKILANYEEYLPMVESAKAKANALYSFKSILNTHVAN